MSLSVVIPLTPEQEQQVMHLLGLGTQAGVSVAMSAGASAPPPAPARPAMPPMPVAPNAGQATVPPPPPAAPPPAPAGKLASVLAAMDTYARAGHQIAGARKVLAVLGLSRAQDADDAQLDWLLAAFSNTSWTP